MKKHKYNATRQKYKNMTFDSKKELKRFKQLELLLNSGKIQNLQLQVPFVLCPAVRIDVNKIFYLGDKKHYKDLTIKQEVKYFADFVYIEKGKQIVEDVKGFKTKEYVKKKNMIKKLYNIEIKEV